VLTTSPGSVSLEALLYLSHLEDWAAAKLRSGGSAQELRAATQAMLHHVKARCNQSDQLRSGAFSPCDVVRLLAAAGKAAQKIGEGAGFSVKHIRAYRLCSGVRKHLIRQVQSPLKILVRAWRRQRQRRQQQARAQSLQQLGRRWITKRTMPSATDTDDSFLCMEIKKNLRFVGSLASRHARVKMCRWLATLLHWRHQLRYYLKQRMDEAVSTHRLYHTQRMIEASLDIMEGYRCLYAGASCSGLLFGMAGPDVQASGSASLEVLMAIGTNPQPIAELPPADTQMEVPVHSSAQGTDASEMSSMHAHRSASIAREGYRCLFRQNERKGKKSVTFIVNLVCASNLTVRVPRSASVDALLAAVDKKWTNTHGPRGGLLRLLTSTGKELQRGCVLADYNLHSNALLSQVPEMRGGMQTTPTSSVHKAHAEAGQFAEADARQKMEALGAKVDEEDADGRITGLDFRDVKLELTLEELSMELSAFKQLTSINLSGLGLTGLPKMDGCSSLTDLSLESCKKLTTEGLAEFCAEPPPKLQNLNLSDTTLESK